MAANPVLPRPMDALAGCVWLPRIIAKARLLRSGRLPEEYASRFCHPTGVDWQFLSFFGLNRDAVSQAAALPDDGVARWFSSLPGATAGRIAEWNRIAPNLGRPGFPMADRLPVALATTYASVAHLKPKTVFEALDADENPA